MYLSVEEKVCLLHIAQVAHRFTVAQFVDRDILSTIHLQRIVTLFEKNITVESHLPASFSEKYYFLYKLFFKPFNAWRPLKGHT